MTLSYETPRCRKNRETDLAIGDLVTVEVGESRYLTVPLVLVQPCNTEPGVLKFKVDLGKVFNNISNNRAWYPNHRVHDKACDGMCGDHLVPYETQVIAEMEARQVTTPHSFIRRVL